MNSLILSHAVVIGVVTWLTSETITNERLKIYEPKYAFLFDWKLTDIICYTADGEVTNFPPSPPQYMNRGKALMDKGKHHCYEWHLQLKNIRNEGALEVKTLLPLWGVGEGIQTTSMGDFTNRTLHSRQICLILAMALDGPNISFYLNIRLDTVLIFQLFLP